MIKPAMYFAAPLFSEAELKYNESLTNILEKYFNVFLPQRDGGLIDDMVRKGSSFERASSIVFKMDIEAINRSEIVFALLDGRAIDEGVAVELGYAYAKGKICIGLQTDIRRLLPHGNNPMIANLLQKLFYNVNELVDWSKQYSRNFDSVQLVCIK